MASGFEARIIGGEQFARVALMLRQASRNDLRLEMLRGLRTAAAPARKAVADSARSTLPREGGLNEVIANSKVTSRSSTSVRSASVRIVATNPHAIAAIDRGVVRHPTYGNREAWVSQQVTPEWFTRPLEQLAPDVQREMAAVLDRIISKLLAA